MAVKKPPWMDCLVKTKTLFLIFLILSATSSYADNWSMDTCKSVSAEVNLSLPMNVDAVTELKNTFCLPHQDGPNFNYNYIVAESIQSIAKSQKKVVKNSWCSTPDLLDMLNSLSGVSFTYYTVNGDFVGKFGFSKKDCN